MSNFSKIGLGTAQFGMPYGISNTFGQTSPIEVASILELARQKGICVIDTAFAYGNSEKILGENNLTMFKIVSKFKLDNDQESPLSQLQVTLKYLKIKSIYAYLSHRPEDILRNSQSWIDLLNAKKNGIIEKIGFSLNAPAELQSLMEKGFKPDVIQVPYNFLDRRFETIMKDAKYHGCEVHSRSVFLQGLFFMEEDLLPSFFNEVKPILKGLKKDINNLPGALLKFALSHPCIDKVIIGINNARQLEMNLESIDSPSHLPAIDHSVSENILMPSKWPKV